MLEIRQERAPEYGEAENVVREAFWNVYRPGCEEHYLLHIMRQCPAFVPELALAAFRDGRMAGYAAGMRAYVEGDDGERREVLTLGPIAVLPQYQRRGIGARLISAVRERAGAAGHRAILLCGDPEFYARQDFEPAEKYGIRDAEDMFADALQVCGLYDGALRGLAGRYHEDEVYCRLDPDAVRVFDGRFPPRTPLSGTPAQRRFLEIAGRRRPFAG